MILLFTRFKRTAWIILAGAYLVGAVVVLKRLLYNCSINGESVRVKLGFDPTTSSLHIGHLGLIRKARQIQLLGHSVVLVVGTATARIGDPTDRLRTRFVWLSDCFVEYASCFLTQLHAVIDVSLIEVKLNTSWTNQLHYTMLLHLMSHLSLGRMLHHSVFKIRIQQRRAVFCHELLYPILQGYDSVMVRSDIELGGCDQVGNMLCGRKAQTRYYQTKQHVLVLPLVADVTGSKKMSKTNNNNLKLGLSYNSMCRLVTKIENNVVFNWLKLAVDCVSAVLKQIRFMDLAKYNNGTCAIHMMLHAHILVQELEHAPICHGFSLKQKPSVNFTNKLICSTWSLLHWLMPQLITTTTGCIVDYNYFVHCGFRLCNGSHLLFGQARALQLNLY